MGILYVILGTFLWAADTLIRYPLLYSGVSAAKIVFFEHFFLVLFFSIFLFRNNKYLKLLKMSRSTFLNFTVIGVFGSAIGTLCFTKAFELINPSLVILLQKLQPFIAFTLAHFILGEKLKKDFIFYAVLAITGGFLISFPDIGAGLTSQSLTDLSRSAIMGYGLTLIAVISWGASTVFGKRLSSSGYSVDEIMSGRFIFGFVFMFFYILATGKITELNTNTDTFLKILFMVILSGLLGMFFYYKGLKLISSRLCAIAELFFPLSAVIINWIFLGKSLLPVQIIGGLLLLCSSLMLQLKTTKD